MKLMADGYTGFLFLDSAGLPEVAMHWEHRFNNMVKRYNTTKILVKQALQRYLT